jgi:Nitrogenase molybdenum-iron protein, alpha and beta chains
MENEPFSVSVSQLAAAGYEGMPEAFTPSCGLVYSSPATLSYNSPGALGFGVKRAALTIPESVMLLVAPDCCGRNSTILSANEGYSRRMFYLRMDETDLITGRHLTMIPEAVRKICAAAAPRPKVVTICITCVDALLGTDLERVCRKAEAETGVRVVPSYMYALTREGRKPPMTAVYQTVYSLLDKRTKRPDAVNVMGFFSQIDPSSELFEVLRLAGVKTVYQAGTCRTLDEYMEMGGVNFNLVLNPESRYAADDLMQRLGVPYIELTRRYDLEKIGRQYALFTSALGVSCSTGSFRQEAQQALDALRAARGSCTFAVGQMINASPFELALALATYGFAVPCILATPSDGDFAYVRHLAGLSPETRVYAPTAPSMANFKPVLSGVDIAVGKDIEPYFPRAAHVYWNSETQPFGFRAAADFFTACRGAL